MRPNLVVLFLSMILFESIRSMLVTSKMSYILSEKSNSTTKLFTSILPMLPVLSFNPIHVQINKEAIHRTSPVACCTVSASAIHYGPNGTVPNLRPFTRLPDGPTYRLWPISLTTKIQIWQTIRKYLHFLCHQARTIKLPY